MGAGVLALVLGHAELVVVVILTPITGMSVPSALPPATPVSLLVVSLVMRGCYYLYKYRTCYPCRRSWLIYIVSKAVFIVI